MKGDPLVPGSASAGAPPCGAEPDLAAFRVPLLLDSRRLALLGLALALILAAGWGGLRGYRAWRHGYLLRQAEAALARKDYRGAVLCARQALGSRPSDRGACRVMAEIAEALESREAIFWRGRVATLPGASVEDRLAWASAALRFDETTLVDEALLSIPPASRRTAEFHTLAGMLAVDAKDLRSAEFHFASVCQLEPTNELGRLNLATVRLRSADPRVVEEARRVLGELSTRPSCALPAQRALLAAALSANQMEEAERIADRLTANSNANWQDRLQGLGVLLRTHPARFEPTLARLQQDAAKRPAEIAQTMSWMVANGMDSGALSWARGFPPEVVNREPVPMAMAEVLAATSNWSDLQRWVEKTVWPGREELRLAWLARACHEQGDSAGSRRSWKAAVASVSSRPMELVLLARVAKRWGWNAEAEEVLWSLAGSSAYQKWALRQLFVLSQERGDTRGLRRVVERALELDPGDKVALNNLALYTLLLHGDVDAASRHAAAVYQSNPSNAVFSSTWAFALHAQGKTAEGLRVLNTLPEKDLRHPALAAYRGILLAATGDTAAATGCLELAKTATLLPEERELVEAALRSIGREVSGKRDGQP